MYEFLPIGYMLRGRYRILRVIGGGGMGAVYKSEDSRRSGALVAVKEMRTDIDTPGSTTHGAPAESEEERMREREERRQLLEAFRREAQILSDLRHDNLPSVTDFFTEGGRPYLVMELIPGESLEKRLDRLHGQPMDEGEALEYGIQICRVLHFLHTQDPPIIFRDVKPANIMVMPNGQVKLIDFGIARTYKEGKRRDTMSMGTAAYAPFEQFGKGQTDARSDVYSLAATLYHLLTGKPPTPATTPISLRDFNHKLSARTEQLIIKAMARDMDVRPQTAEGLETEFRRCLGRPYEPPHADGPISYTSGPVGTAPGASAAAGSAGSQPGYFYGSDRSTGPSSQSTNAAPVAANASVAPAPSASVATAQGLPRVSAPGANGASAPITDDQTDTEQEEHTCMVCGYTNHKRAHFCGRCGASLAGRPPGKLQVLGPNGVLWERRIVENPFNIGRRSLSRQIFPHLDLTYNDPAAYVSRQHARIVADAGGYFLEDLGSANGTFLNDRRLPAGVPTRMRNGDRVRIGKVQMTFILGN
jgi:serine/threonine-protein kinase